VRCLLELGPTLIEVCRVARVLRRIEIGRCTLGPKPLLDELRHQGTSACSRDSAGRMRLRRAIRWLDVFMGRNCFRRALLEIALDRGAAAEPLFLGLTFQGKQPIGHAWLSTHGSPPVHYELVLQL